jgi:import inner membrane translocase subunit TIM16
MAANDVSKGGSFYLQSKVYRAKELLDEYVEEKKTEERATTETAAQPPGEEEKRS